MPRGITRGEENLILLESLIPSNETMYVWLYHISGNMIATSCPDHLREVLEQAFMLLGAHDKAAAYIKEYGTDKPMIIGSSVGLQWAVTYESEREKEYFFIVGPVFYSQPDAARLRSALYDTPLAQNHLRWINALCAICGEIPMMAYAIFSRYVVMVHNTLTGQHAGTEALQNWQDSPVPSHERAAGERDRLSVYRAEKALLQMVREGNINYQGALQQSIGLSPGVPIQGKDPLRQMKTSMIVFTSLVCRAAMEGGLSPEVAYELGDSYIQTAENCRDSGELSAMANAMYHDFIYRVHYLHSNPNYSHAVQKCCDYIELCLDRRIRAADLAALVGYTEYYLTEKFRKETGKTVSQYIRDAKINRAKILLESTSQPVAEIAEHLAFNTPNYFIQCFKEQTGLTPAQYRKQKVRIPNGF